MSDVTLDITAFFPDELVTQPLTRDVDLPYGAGTMALITLDNGKDHTKPNTLGPGFLTRLDAVLDTLAERAERGEIAAVGVTGKPFIFAAGADLTGVQHITTRDQGRAVGELGHRALGRLSTLGVPSFAFINGAALGGGLEVALHCTYRTISGAAGAIALPEVFLGMVPGWGGCWLLPNLVGITSALTLVVENPLSMNKMLTPSQANRLGLADVLLDPSDFLAESIRWASRVLIGAQSVPRPSVDHDEDRWDDAIQATKSLVDMRTGGFAPAAYRALNLLSQALHTSREEGFAAEDDALADLLVSDELRAGLYTFDLTQKRAKRPAGAPDPSAALPVTKVGVVGAGLMAGQLALLLVRRLEVPLVMTDLDEPRVARGVGYVHGELDNLVAKGRLSARRASRYKALVTGSTDLASLADAQFVIEAVFEEMGVKKKVWADVEAVVAPEAVLATNTSSLSVTEMAADLAHPERVVGVHFFNPVAVMPLVEIVAGTTTGETALATAFAVGRKLGKTTVLVQDSPSFIVNRLLGRFTSDVSRIVDEGTPIDVADRGFAGIAPMPPFVLLGLVGPRIALHNTESLAAAFPDRFYVSPNLRRVVEAGKSAFYVWPEGRPALDPEVLALYEPADNPVVLSPAQVRERLLSGLAEEARLMLDEGVVAAPMDLDLAMITGAGFQAWNGGLTPLLDRTGLSEKVTGRRFLPVGVASVAAPA